MKYFFPFLLMLYALPAFSQLGFCEGSKGDPIFHEDFGSGSGTGPALPPGTTDYTYVTGPPAPGDYTIWEVAPPETPWWFSDIPRGTPSGGRFLLVDADYDSGLFYETEISGLCENTSYEFSAFLMNLYDAAHPLCPNGGIPINVRFEIWDETGTQLLNGGSTGDIQSAFSPEWEEYALTFQSEPGQNAIILRMYNNGEGGCGNDVAIDDIIFRSCGDLTTVTSEENDEDEYAVCEPDAPVSLTLTAKPDHSVYEQHAFQWQESDDDENWSDIPAETGENYTTPALQSSRYYRVKVAEDEVNLSNNLCSSASESFLVNIIETPEAPESNGNVEICGDDEIPSLSVSVADDETVNWYDALTGGNLLETSSSSFTPEEEGVFYAEAVKRKYECEASSRTPVSLTVNESPLTDDEALQICENDELDLDAGIANMNYQWNTGEISRRIAIDRPGNFSVEITTTEGCSVTKNFDVTAVDVAGIDEIISEEANITIVPAHEGEFEYSLDGSNFQSSNTFREVSGGIYRAYIRDMEACAIVSEEFPHIVVPKFITPNGDGYNDTFRLRGVEYFEASEIKIFDRYGKLLKAGPGQNFSWDGTFNGRKLPASDYWYEINIPGYGLIKGNVSLQR